MKIGIIVALSILLVILLIMLVCTYKVRGKVTEQFRCKKCLKINNTLKNRCEYCRELMSKGYVYKSTFLGRTDCKDEHGYFDLAITMKHIKLDIAIWNSLCALDIIGIILVNIFM